MNNTPKLRFPEFEGEWKKKKLGEIGINVIDGDRGTNYPNGADFQDEGYCLFMNAKNVTKNGFSFIEKSFITKEKDELLRKGKLQRFDIVITTRGSVGHISYYDMNVPFVHLRINSGMALIRTTKEFIHSDYLYKYFNSNQIQNEVDKISFGSAQPQLTISEIVKLKISFPSFPEQSKIATFLTSVDEKLTQLKKKKSLLEQYKKGVMQKLFSQELRFKDDTSTSLSASNGEGFAEWEEKKLGEIGETYNGLTGKSKENFGQGKPYIQYKQIFDDTKIDISRFDYVEIDGSDKQNKVEFGDIFFTVSSETPDEVGMSSVLLDYVDELYLNSFCFGYRAFSLDILNPFYARFLFRSELFRKEVILLAQGSTRYNLSKVGMMKITISLPSLSEQTKIANFLSAIDEKISLCGVQIEKMESWKKGLLQGMFV